MVVSCFVHAAGVTGMTLKQQLQQTQQATSSPPHQGVLIRMSGMQAPAVAMTEAAAATAVCSCSGQLDDHQQRRPASQMLQHVKAALDSIMRLLGTAATIAAAHQQQP
jgi:hypothetical protein